MTKSNADFAVECAQQLSQHDTHRSTLIRMSMAIRDLQTPQRTWVDLTEEEIYAAIRSTRFPSTDITVSQSVIEAFKEKNK